jgi:hypothetical protein
MKRTLLLLFLFTGSQFTYSQQKTLLQIILDKGDVSRVQLSDVKSFSRYEMTDHSSICGYYSEADSCFYDCKGVLYTKIAPQHISPDLGCCGKQSIVVNFGKLHEKSKWMMDDLTFVGVSGKDYNFVARDSTKYSIRATEVAGLKNISFDKPLKIFIKADF